MEPQTTQNENSPMKIFSKSEHGFLTLTPQGQLVDRVTKEAIIPSELFSEKDFFTAAKMIRSAFPAVDKDWLGLFSDMAKDEGYSGEQLITAVKNAIKTIDYNHTAPPVSKFLSQSNRVKMLSYFDVEKEVHKGDNWKNFKMIARLDNLAYFARVADMIKYGLKPMVLEDDKS